MKFIAWDYVTSIATEYERRGECNQCGDCCRKTINMDMVEGDKNAHGGRGTNGAGIWSEIADADPREFVRFYLLPYEVLETMYKPKDIHRPCTDLDENNLCISNGEKPWICSIWPTGPHDIKKFPNCSYEFVKGDSWQFGHEEIDNAAE